MTEWKKDLTGPCFRQREVLSPPTEVTLVHDKRDELGYDASSSPCSRSHWSVQESLLFVSHPSEAIPGSSVNRLFAQALTSPEQPLERLRVSELAEHGSLHEKQTGLQEDWSDASQCQEEMLFCDVVQVLQYPCLDQ